MLAAPNLVDGEVRILSMAGYDALMGERGLDSGGGDICRVTRIGQFPFWYRFVFQRGLSCLLRPHNE